MACKDDLELVTPCDVWQASNFSVLGWIVYYQEIVVSFQVYQHPLPW